MKKPKLPKIHFQNLFHTWKASFHTRSFRVGGYSVAAAGIVMAIAVVVNLIAGALPSKYTQFDTTSNQLFSISEQTQTLVRSLSEDVTIYWVVQSGREDSTLENLLNRYQDLSSHIQVVKKDPDVYPTFVQQYTDKIYNNSLIVESGSRSRYISYNDIYVYDYSNYYYSGSYDVSFDGESALTSAIDYCVSQALPRVYNLTGHGEATLSSTYSTAVEKENIELTDISLLTLEAIPEDADAILINTPQSDIAEEEKALLEAYLSGGGNLILITDPPQEGSLTNLEALMANYGVTAVEGIVVEGNPSNYAFGTPYYLLPTMSSHDITSSLNSQGYRVLLPVSQGLQVSQDLSSNLSVKTLLQTSDDAFSKLAGYDLTTYQREEGDISGPFDLAVAITDTAEDGTQSQLIWVSSGALLDEQTNAKVSGGNLDFFLNCLNWMCGAEESRVSIHAKAISQERLTLDSQTASMLSILVVGVIPLAYLAIGITIWVRRKRR